MPKPKTFLPKLEVDIAKKAHNCQHNKRHRLEAGDKRLKVTENRSDEHFCVACALESIQTDIAKLQSLAAELQNSA